MTPFRLVSVQHLYEGVCCLHFLPSKAYVGGSSETLITANRTAWRYTQGQ